MISVCIPTLNAVDDFWKCVGSIMDSSISCNIYAIDNGGLVSNSFPPNFMTIHKPESNLGVAGSWNWFIDNVPGAKVITNDDIVFDSYAIEQLWIAYARDTKEGISNIIAPENLESTFSCFLLPQTVVDKVGKFDEWISPKYAYFEDNDYHYRMSMLGIQTTRASGSFVSHVGSSTLKHFNKLKEKEHHDKFRLARTHYVRKWGGEPGQEKFTTPFGK